MASRHKRSEPTPSHLVLVSEIVQQLGALGLEPVLVGGMVLVLLGSHRVTRDFDFEIGQPGDQLPGALDVRYDRGLALAAQLNGAREVTATIGNRRVASAHLRLDEPGRAFLYNTATGLRIDVLFDFPIPAQELAGQSLSARTPARALRVASAPDLLKLKKIACSNRSLSTDDQHIAFLESRRNLPRD